LVISLTLKTLRCPSLAVQNVEDRGADAAVCLLPDVLGQRRARKQNKNAVDFELFIKFIVFTDQMN
jgi:hypothetical protein